MNLNRCVAAIFAGLLALTATLAQAAIPIQRDIIYRDLGERKLALDIAVPAADGPLPAIVIFHGIEPVPRTQSDFHETMRFFAERGYVAAAVEYRVPPVRFPLPVDDAKTAVRFLRQRAKQYKIDPQRMGAWGVSLGGAIALAVGLTDDAWGVSKPALYAGHSSRIQAVVDRYGPTDFTTIPRDAHNLTLMYLTLGTTDQTAAAVRDASPIAHVGKGSPPVLIMHGRRDEKVPFAQAESLHAALLKAGVPTKLYELRGDFHSSEMVGRTAEDRAENRRCLEMEVEWFDRHLNNAKPQERRSGAPAIPPSAAGRDTLAADGWGAARVFADVVYSDTGAKKLHMDIAVPPGGARMPALVMFPGGIAVQESRQRLYSTMQFFVSHGYVVAGVEYRGPAAGVFPACIDDAKTAVRFLRAHSEQYRLDPERIGAWGVSMGAGVALMLAVTDDEFGTSKNGAYGRFSSRVCAVAERYGPTDLTGIPQDAEKRLFLLLNFGTADPKSPALRQASPLSHVSKGAAPVLAMHSRNDNIVPFRQSEAFCDALRKAGAPTKLVEIKTAAHGGEFHSEAPALRAINDECRREELAWFDRYVKKQSHEPGEDAPEKKAD